jgi:hypothetical protein
VQLIAIIFASVTVVVAMLVVPLADDGRWWDRLHWYNRCWYDWCWHYRLGDNRRWHNGCQYHGRGDSLGVGARSGIGIGAAATGSQNRGEGDAEELFHWWSITLSKRTTSIKH